MSPQILSAALNAAATAATDAASLSGQRPAVGEPRPDAAAADSSAPGPSAASSSKEAPSSGDVLKPRSKSSKPGASGSAPVSGEASPAASASGAAPAGGEEASPAPRVAAPPPLQPEEVCARAGGAPRGLSNMCVLVVFSAFAWGVCQGQERTRVCAIAPKPRLRANAADTLRPVLLTQAAAANIAVPVADGEAAAARAKLEASAQEALLAAKARLAQAPALRALGLSPATPPQCVDRCHPLCSTSTGRH